jgi:spermidine synthase
LIPLIGIGTTVGAAVGQLLLGAAILPGSSTGQGPTRRSGGASPGRSVRRAPTRVDVLMMNSGVYMNVQEVDASKGWAEFQRQYRKTSEVVYARDGLTASILVARQLEIDNIYLAVNGKIDASSREDLETQIMLGQLPLLIHPAPRDVLIVGLASGITAGSAATHPVEHIRVVEVEGKMVGAARQFGRHNHGVLDDARVTVSINDARNELQFSPRDYDVILSRRTRG